MSDTKSASHYRGEQGRAYHEQKRGIPDAAFSWVAQSRADKIAQYIKATDTVFEYGVGWGWNLAGLNCARKIGFDVAEVVQEKVRERGIETVASVDLIADSSVDVVLCHHTLEHLLEPVAALRQMRRVLRADGKLVLFVPYERESKYTRFQRGEPNHHLYAWNCQTLGNLVEDCGFKVCESDVTMYGYDRFAASWANRFGLGAWGFCNIKRMVMPLKPIFEVRVIATRA
jgi:SAM-dependent methyltransferase